MLTIDLRDFERRAKSLGAAIDQVPFALANTLTTAAFKARTFLVTETWPQSITVRSKSFLRAALHVEPATKHNLTVAVVDTLGRAHLGLHAKGGTKLAKKRLAIPPTGTVSRTAKGVAKSQLPRAIRANTPARALRVLPQGIFVGRGGRLHLAYAFKPSAVQRKDVPFHEDFERAMKLEMFKAYPAALRRAMRTRKKD